MVTGNGALGIYGIGEAQQHPCPCGHHILLLWRFTLLLLRWCGAGPGWLQFWLGWLNGWGWLNESRLDSGHSLRIFIDQDRFNFTSISNQGPLHSDCISIGRTFPALHHGVTSSGSADNRVHQQCGTFPLGHGRRNRCPCLTSFRSPVQWVGGNSRRSVLL